LAKNSDFAVWEKFLENRTPTNAAKVHKIMGNKIESVKLMIDKLQIKSTTKKHIMSELETIKNKFVLQM